MCSIAGFAKVEIGCRTDGVCCVSLFPFVSEVASEARSVADTRMSAFGDTRTSAFGVTTCEGGPWEQMFDTSLAHGHRICARFAHGLPTYGCRAVPLGLVRAGLPKRLDVSATINGTIVFVLFFWFVEWSSSRLAFRCLPTCSPVGINSVWFQAIALRCYRPLWSLSPPRSGRLWVPGGSVSTSTVALRRYGLGSPRRTRHRPSSLASRLP